MQQASSSIGNLVPTSGNALPPNAASVRFVVNLCASTTPVGLVQTSHAGLKRFTFFVSRRLEEGRERFRLHMGYFESQEEAEKILDLVRDVYPAAWAGVAPGIKLRSRANAAAAGAIAAPSVASAPAVALVAAPPKLELVPEVPQVGAATRSLSDIRATIDSLGDTGQNVKPTAAAPGLDSTAVLRLLESAPTQATTPTNAVRAVPLVPNQAPVAKRPSPAAPSHLTAAQPRPTAARSSPQMSPVLANEPAMFAVQLLWSVQPIDMKEVPQLAIFSAYTLYGAEGNRDGRRWYGLRLGFFTDAVSAKQVAQYVRSEFTSVSVVPVTVRERTRADAATAKPLPAISTDKRAGPELNFIEDVPTDTATSGSRPALKIPELSAAGESPGVRAAAAALGLTARATPGKRAKARVAQGTKPVSKRPNHGRPLSLEETLEILGAGELQVDRGRGERMNDASLHERKLSAPVSRFGRLINRLAERLGNS